MNLQHHDSYYHNVTHTHKNITITTKIKIKYYHAKIKTHKNQAKAFKYLTVTATSIVQHVPRFYVAEPFYI
jgi:hypothetical protein